MAKNLILVIENRDGEDREETFNVEKGDLVPRQGEYIESGDTVYKINRIVHNYKPDDKVFRKTALFVSVAGKPE